MSLLPAVFLLALAVDGGGANALALIDEINGGVILVGTKLPGWGQPVLDAVDQVMDLPVTTLINMHADPDHAGANGEFRRPLPVTGNPGGADAPPCSCLDHCSRVVSVRR